ncbi:MAG: hypothetical protein GXO80_09345 [Chlorobi bacterium]|nr:hypothetical protein [Chlorobiota bacterium]
MLKTIAHITVSILILILTIGISINKHYSNGKLFSWSVLGDAETCDAGINEVCEMQNMPNNCETHKMQVTPENTNTSCSCEDTSEYLHFDTDYTVPEKINADNVFQQEITLFINSTVAVQTNFFRTQNQTFGSGKQKLKIPDFTSLYQVFIC